MLIKQRKNNDCLVAATAMFFSKTYREIVELTATMSEYHYVFLRDAKLPISFAKRTALLLKEYNCSWTKTWDSDKKAILLIKVDTSLHTVFVEDLTVYDPKSGTSKELPAPIYGAFQVC